MKIKHEPKREAPTMSMSYWLLGLDLGTVFSIANGNHTYMKVSSEQGPLYVSLLTGCTFLAKEFAAIKIADVHSYPCAELHTGQAKPAVR